MFVIRCEFQPLPFSVQPKFPIRCLASVGGLLCGCKRSLVANFRILAGRFRGSMARATRSQLGLDLPLMLKSVYPMGESSGANNRTCVLCFDLAVLLAD